jgi:hypothetical protein
VTADFSIASITFFFELVRNSDFEFYLRQKVDDVFSTSIEFSVTFLSSKALNFYYGDTLYTDIGQGFSDFIKLKQLDNRSD